jgi:putative transposase
MGTYTCLQYHFVFATKDREPYITEEIRPRLYDYIGATIRADGGVLKAIGGMPDHLHLFVSFRADMAISDLMRDVKANSSGWIRQNFDLGNRFQWQVGYGAFTVSRSQAKKLESYIARQTEHHRKKSFKEELIELLEAHGIEYDERYLWE